MFVRHPLPNFSMVWTVSVIQTYSIMSTYIYFYPGLYNYVCEGKGASKIRDIQKKYKCQTSICEERDTTTVERDEEFRGEEFREQEDGVDEERFMTLV